MRPMAAGLTSGLILCCAGSLAHGDGFGASVHSSPRVPFVTPDHVASPFHFAHPYLFAPPFQLTPPFRAPFGVGPLHSPFDFHPRDFRTQSFRRVATLPNFWNRSDASETTVSEIVAATKDGKVLAYTDALSGSLGFVSIHNPAYPMPFGTVALGGDPTSVDVLGNQYALVGVNTGSFAEPSGHLAVVDVKTRAIVAEIDLGGQPDSVKISPDERFVAVAIENERDEDVEVGGVEGGLPQLPAGFLAIVDIDGDDPSAWTVRTVSVSGYSEYAPDDPEPEFVDINDRNEAVVTLQENNHIVIVDLEKGVVIGDFPAGAVDLHDIDVDDDFVISPTDSLYDVAREPDAVAWIPLGRGDYGIATANEGDLFGGSRGFTIFRRDGKVLYDAGNRFEHLAMRHGHYPEDRSDNKGTEPESILFARFGRDRLLFIGSERGGFVAVYEIDGAGQPEFRQLLPAPFGPEGLLAIPERGLLVVSGEEDDPTFGVRSTMMIYQLEHGRPSYPQIVSQDGPDGLPTPWGALSGLVAVGRDELLAVWDSYYTESRILRIDVSRQPAVITDTILIQGGSGNYDPEGIAVAPDGTYWIASEGNASDSRPNLLVQTDVYGNVLQEIGLPAEILACRAAERALGDDGRTGTYGSGFEGVAVIERGRSYRLAVAQQRGWDYTTPGCEDLDDDALGLDANGEPKQSRIWLYDPRSGDWDHLRWELAPVPTDALWVGLSEITTTPTGELVVIERDNRTGDWAELKTLVKFDMRRTKNGLVTAKDKSVYDLIPALGSTHGWMSDKPEGTAIMPNGDVYVVTDNDGVEDWSGETSFLKLGKLSTLFRPQRR